MERKVGEHKLHQMHALAAEARQHRCCSTVNPFQRQQGEGQVSWCALLSMLKYAEVYNKLHFSVL
jgi:hypothetical protein